MSDAVAAEIAAYLALEGEGINVREVCTRLGISRSTFYKYLARFRREGVQGLFPRSRRPHNSPRKLPTALEDVLIALRKHEAGTGFDYGADAVLLRLEEQREQLWPPGRALPSRATVNRVFDARGQLAPVPRRRPRRANRRFARSSSNELWQFDAFTTKLATGTKATVMHVTDDCSRVDLALQAAPGETAEAVWNAFTIATSRYGLPATVLTDNGIAFSGRRRGWTGVFEQHLRDLGIRAITSSIRHPQTCGKNERAHQRVQKWLAQRPRPATTEELQTLLDEYRDAFNNRRCQVLGAMTPHERHALGPIAQPAEYTETVRVTRHTVSKDNKVHINKLMFKVRPGHQHQQAVAFIDGLHALIYVGHDIVADTIIDTTQRYQRQSR